MLTGFRFKVDGLRARFPSVNFGYGDADPSIVRRTPHYMVLKRRPVRDWLCRGEKCWRPAQWYLIRYGEAGDGFLVVLQVVDERTPGHQWQAHKAQLLGHMEHLEKERRAAEKGVER